MVRKDQVCSGLNQDGWGPVRNALFKILFQIPATFIQRPLDNFYISMYTEPENIHIDSSLKLVILDMDEAISLTSQYYSKGSSNNMDSSSLDLHYTSFVLVPKSFTQYELYHTYMLVLHNMNFSSSKKIPCVLIHNTSFIQCEFSGIWIVCFVRTPFQV